MFSEELRKLRKQKKINQASLAEAIGMSQATIASWESGKRKPDVETLAILAEYFSVSVDYLLGRDDPATYEQLASRAQEEADLLGNEIMRQIKTLPEDTQRHLLEKWQGEVDFLKSLDK